MQVTPQKRGLGRGLASLIPGKISTQVPQPDALHAILPELEKSAHDAKPQVEEIRGIPLMVSIHNVVANRQQPRTAFDEEALKDLADSIKQAGVLQPLLVTPLGDGRFELIAGERRLRASRLAGLAEVPVFVKEKLETDQMLELAIIENIQREDLNDIEEAKAYAALIDQYGYHQNDISEKLGKSRPYVANLLRLLQLPKLVQDDVVQGRMSGGHARALLGLSDLQEQLSVREQILNAQLSVRDVERIIQERRGKQRNRTKNPTAADAVQQLSPQMKFVQEELTKILGTKVRIRPQSAATGALQIEYYSLQDLDRLYRKLRDDEKISAS